MPPILEHKYPFRNTLLRYKIPARRFPKQNQLRDLALEGFGHEEVLHVLNLLFVGAYSMHLGLCEFDHLERIQDLTTAIVNRHPYVLYIDLWGNALRDHGVYELLLRKRAGPIFRNLRVLNLSRCGLTSVGLAHVFRFMNEGSRANNIRALSFANNRMSYISTELFIASKSIFLLALDLSDAELGVRGANIISNYIRDNFALRLLGLSFNRFSGPGVMKILNAVISQIEFSLRQLQQGFAITESRRGLQRLCLRGNGALDRKSLSSLFRLLELCPWAPWHRLEYVDMRLCIVDQLLWAKFQSMMRDTECDYGEMSDVIRDVPENAGIASGAEHECITGMVHGLDLRGFVLRPPTEYFFDSIKQNTLRKEDLEGALNLTKMFAPSGKTRQTLADEEYRLRALVDRDRSRAQQPQTESQHGPGMPSQSQTSKFLFVDDAQVYACDTPQQGISVESPRMHTSGTGFTFSRQAGGAFPDFHDQHTDGIPRSYSSNDALPPSSSFPMRPESSAEVPLQASRLKQGGRGTSSSSSMGPPASGRSRTATASSPGCNTSAAGSPHHHQRSNHRAGPNKIDHELVDLRPHFPILNEGNLFADAPSVSETEDTGGVEAEGSPDSPDTGYQAQEAVPLAGAETPGKEGEGEGQEGQGDELPINARNPATPKVVISSSSSAANGNGGGGGDLSIGVNGPSIRASASSSSRAAGFKTVEERDQWEVSTQLAGFDNVNPAPKKKRPGIVPPSKIDPASLIPIEGIDRSTIRPKLQKSVDFGEFLASSFMEDASPAPSPTDDLMGASISHEQLLPLDELGGVSSISNAGPPAAKSMSTSTAQSGIPGLQQGLPPPANWTQLGAPPTGLGLASSVAPPTAHQKSQRSGGIKTSTSTGQPLQIHQKMKRQLVSTSSVPQGGNQMVASNNQGGNQIASSSTRSPRMQRARSARMRALVKEFGECEDPAIVGARTLEKPPLLHSRVKNDKIFHRGFAEYRLKRNLRNEVEEFEHMLAILEREKAWLD
ncbi:unnamed protein product [Amoebophrya sp. A25]|nr:unnamed protein product [Amoebophrya sp. A25]|eukprot:GSA25T00018527001.1